MKLESYPRFSSMELMQRRFLTLETCERVNYLGGDSAVRAAILETVVLGTLDAACVSRHLRQLNCWCEAALGSPAILPIATALLSYGCFHIALGSFVEVSKKWIAECSKTVVIRGVLHAPQCKDHSAGGPPSRDYHSP